MTITVKKQFEELYSLLQANDNKKIKTLMPQIEELMARKNSASGQASTFIKDDEGNVVAIFCYYHKKWELVDECQYGAKKSTATGLNTMCKQGVSSWTKQQRVKRLAESELLTKLSAGEIAPTEIGYEQKLIQDASKAIVDREDGLGYLDADEAMEVHNNKLGEEL